MPNTDSPEQETMSVGLSIVESQERANIDMLISTAKKFPRDIVQVKRSMEALATLDLETAEGCNYTLKRKDKNGVEVLIQGPSVRMAEIAISTYGNIRAGSRVIANDGKVITGQAFCHDLENNTFVAWEIQRRITDKNGRTYGEDLQVLTGNAASAIAFRNAVFKVIPGALIKPVADKALQVAVGDIKTLEQRRMRALKKFASLGVDESRILSFLGKTSVAQIDIVDVENLFGIFTAIKEGSVLIEEQFPVSPQIVKPNFEQAPAREAAPIPISTAETEPVKRGPGRPRKTAEPLRPLEPAKTEQEEPKAQEETPKEPPPASGTEPAGSLFSKQESAPHDPAGEVLKRLRELGVPERKFLELMQEYGFADCEPGDITMGDFTIAKMEAKDLELALKNWAKVEQELKS